MSFEKDFIGYIEKNAMHNTISDGEAFLEHFGKKGMRWRNRKGQTDPVSAPSNKGQGTDLNKMVSRDSYTKKGFSGLSRGEKALVAGGAVAAGIVLARIGSNVLYMASRSIG